MESVCDPVSWKDSHLGNTTFRMDRTAAGESLTLTGVSRKREIGSESMMLFGSESGEVVLERKTEYSSCPDWPWVILTSGIEKGYMTFSDHQPHGCKKGSEIGNMSEPVK